MGRGESFSFYNGERRAGPLGWTETGLLWEFVMVRTYASRASVVLLVLLPSLSWAQPLTPRDIDARLDNQLYEVLRIGTDLYNRGSKDACYRLYQGSLMSIVNFLDHRPDQAAQIHRALREADGMTNLSDRAFALRKAIDDLRATFKPGPATTSLWDRLGGEPGVTGLVDDFVTRAIANPRVNFTRRGTGREWEANPDNVIKLKRAMVQMVSAATGGPLRYVGRDMKPLHTGMKITEAEFNDMITDVKASLEHQRIAAKEQDDLLKIIMGTKADIVEAEAVPGLPVPPGPPKRALWERLGGEPMVTRIVEDFTITALTNAKLNFSRRGTAKMWLSTPPNMELLRKRLVQMISAVTGGPIKYEGRDMKTVHQGMAITAEEFDAMVVDLKTSLEKFKIGTEEQEELIKLIQTTRGDIVEKK
jgi:hemoglobin